MQLSRLGQGLAVSAVSALAISGLAVTASPVFAADAPGVRLLSQYDGAAASVRLDRDAGFSDARTVTLTASHPDPGATISFEYNVDPTAGESATGWTAVEDGTNTVGPYGSLAWTPDPSLVGRTIALRAVAATAATETTPATTTYDVRNAVSLTDEASAVQAVAIGTGLANAFSGFFVQPYADSSRTATLLRVDGTTSAPDGTVELSAWNASAGSFQGHTDAAVRSSELKTGEYDSSGAPIVVDGGRFTAALDISAFDAQDGDALAVRAERDSDSVVAARLTAQTIGSIDLVEAPVTDLEDTVVTLGVLDQVSRRVVGAEVRRSSDGTLVGYTDAEGEVAVTQPNSTTARYYVNTTDVDAFEEGVDVVTDPIDTPDFVPVATSTEAVFADGTVFDDQEYVDGDIALRVLDQLGRPLAGQHDLAYSLEARGQEPSGPTTVTTDESGRFVVPFDPSGDDGEYTLSLFAPDSAGGAELEPVTFVAGDAALGLTPLAGKGASGDRIAYAGTLTVEGEPLAGRSIDLGYTRGTELAPGTEADAALVIGDGRALAGELTTSGDGSFSVTVGDIAETGSPAETGGRLRVTARGLGDTIEATADFGEPAAPSTNPSTNPGTDTGTDTGADRGTVKVKLAGANAGPRKDRLRITAPTSVSGEKVRIYAKVAGGTWRVVKRLKLDRKGDAAVKVRDRNGSKVTRYYVKLLPSATVAGSTSKVIRLR